ncbi:hypothetical protein [Chryseobacterium wanjuense]
MRLSNRNKTSVYSFVNTLLLMFLAAGIGAYLLEEYRFNILGRESLLLIIIPVMFLGFFISTEDKFLSMIVTEKLFISEIGISSLF